MAAFTKIYYFFISIIMSICLTLDIPMKAMGRPVDLTGYELVWNDEFDGTELDTSKWRGEQIALGSALPLKEERRVLVRGRDMITNLPQTAEISSSAVYEALKGTCQAILAAIQHVLERTPPELAGDVMKSGIHLTGGASQLFALDQYIASELDMPVLLARDPMSCAALGAGHLADNIELLHRIGKSSFLREEDEE